MEKEKVTEELVRQNGNQAAAVMADFAGGGGSGGGGGNLPDYLTLCAEVQFRNPTPEDLAKLSSDPGRSKVVDLPNSKIPLILYEAKGGDVAELTILYIAGVTPAEDGTSEIDHYDVRLSNGLAGLITKDKTLLFILIES